MSMATELNAAGWGPLSTAVHGPVPDGRPPWKDNAFLTFWDVDRDVFGTVHVSTSPNAEGRRARISVSIAGKVAEIIEQLEPATFRSPSIDFGLDGPTTVDSRRLSATLVSTPHQVLADYTAGSVIPPLVPGEPMHHYQRAARVAGTLVLDGAPVEIDGFGFRDRTWGYRDESANISEYIALMLVTPGHAYTVIRLRGTEGADLTEGYRLGPDSAERITGISITRDASSLLAVATLEFADGQSVRLRNRGRHGGFWLPMGWERNGPTIGAYDEFFDLNSEEGETGFGMAEHGVVRHLY